MNDVALAIKSSGDNIEIVRVSRIVSAENSVRHMVRKLNQSACLGVHEQRDLSEMLDISPPRSKLSEILS
jgi:hypothetical protein